MPKEFEAWVDKLTERLEEFLELESPGAFDVRFNDAEGQLIIAPDVLELVGGEHDGDNVYPHVTIHLSVLADEFDETPEVIWTTMHDELWVEGKIGGEDAS